MDLLSEIPFYEELNVINTNHTITGYAMSYKIELVEKKDTIEPLEASKSSMKDSLNDLLNETKGFKYQIALKLHLKNASRKKIEFTPVYFSSTTKTVINQKFGLDKSFG